MLNFRKEKTIIKKEIVCKWLIRYMRCRTVIYNDFVK